LESYHSFVKKLAEAFECAKIDYAFTGALAVSYYGAPRTTTDVDIMVGSADEANLKNKIALALNQAGLDFDTRKIETALASNYNIATFTCKESPYTLDIIISAEKLEKKTGKIDSFKTFFQSPEGLIAAKLRMIKATLPPERAEKDKQDVKSILAFTKVDINVVEELAKKDSTTKIFQALTA